MQAPETRRAARMKHGDISLPVLAAEMVIVVPDGRQPRCLSGKVSSGRGLWAAWI